MTAAITRSVIEAALTEEALKDAEDCFVNRNGVRLLLMSFLLTCFLW